MTTRKIVVMAVASALAGGTQMAQATDVFRLEGYGAISRAMGGTAVAHDVGPAGMMTNPATLSLMADGDQAMVGLDLVTTDITVRNKTTGETVSSDTHSNNRGPYVAPEAAFTKRVGALSFGVGAFAQGGLGTEYGNGSFLSSANGGLASGLENSSRLLVLNIPFAASYQATDKLTIGGSLDAMWQGLNLDLLLGTDQVLDLIGSGRATGGLVPVLGGMLPALKGAHFSLTKDKFLASGVDAWGYGGKLGMLYKATPETTLGASYTFKSQMNDMEGDATLTAVTTGGNVALNGKIKIQDFQMPAHIDLGVSQRLGSQWLVTADISRVFWKDVMKDIKVNFVHDGGLGDINILLPQDNKDQTILSLGTAYQLNDSLTLRGGLRFASQALRSSTLFAVIPATPRKHLSAGLTYTLSKQAKLDFAYSHAFKETMDNTSLPNTSPPIEVSHSQNNATLNFRYSF
ncbi:OmpP1/FadL family transporter [Dechloromonas sp. HYN0024]|uniref:OmpP1/FadL family transporter n=1 Tax=Dechloromonas sp. HYN0024 TaxID=2231055 RepID=UPI000E43D5A3|nr:outer membrane protein transport protein [Dechloromonas sp. HYN0024]AXS81494.1 aromatic hydrocarbon degradation protein [Dechloromonas sp. HYN0024]